MKAPRVTPLEGVYTSTVAPVDVAHTYGSSGLYFEKAFFILASPDDRFIKSFSEGLLQQPEFYLDGPDGRANFVIERIKISEGYRRCNLMSLRIQASPELLKFAYDAGLGEKNAMGFGCVDVVGQSNR